MLRRLLPGTATLAYDELAYRQFGMDQKSVTPRSHQNSVPAILSHPHVPVSGKKLVAVSNERGFRTPRPKSTDAIGEQSWRR